MQNAEKEAVLGNLTADRMLQFLQKASSEIDKMVVKKANIPALTRLSNFIEDIIITSLDGLETKLVRFRLHKNICLVTQKLIEHCPVMNDASIDKLKFSAYLADERHCDREHRNTIIELCNWFMFKCKGTDLKQILYTTTH